MAKSIRNAQIEIPKQNEDLLEEEELYRVIRDNKMIYAKTTFKRAIPYYKDGLIMVHRRILFSMLKSGLTYNVETRKSAKVVGDVMGSYHPHGDSSIYNAMITLSQNWTNNYPTIHGQGNWGNVFGDAAAAQRYTECKLTKFFCDIVEDISPNYVNYDWNYDDTTQEVEYLPFKIPLLLLNGSYGIAESYISSAPPHNLTDVVRVCKKYVIDKTISNEKLVEGLLPDFPNYGVIVNGNEIVEVYKYGQPVDKKIAIKMKSHLEIDRMNNTIIIKDLPYGITRKTINDIMMKKHAEKHPIMSKIYDLIEIKTKRNGEDHIEYEVVFDKNANILEIANALEKFCLTKSIPLSFILQYGDHVKVASIKDIVAAWYDTLKTTILRKISYQTSQTQIKLHILEGTLIIYDHVDEIIDYIKKVDSDDQLIKWLSDKFKLSAVQAKSIADMQLKNLKRVSKVELVNNIANLKMKVEALDREVFTVDRKILDDLTEINNKYAKPRRTEIISELEIKEVTSVPISNGVLLWSHNQYAIFDTLNVINGKALINGLKTYKLDGRNVKEIIGCTNVDKDIQGLLVLGKNGEGMRRIVPADFGPINNWILDSEISCVVPITNESQKIFCITKSKKIKLIEASQIMNKNWVNVGDVEYIQILNEKVTHITILTESGKYHMVKLKDIPLLGRTASGVTINLPDENYSVCQFEMFSDESFIVSLLDKDNIAYIMRVDQEYFEETNRVNKVKKLFDFDDEYKITNISTFNPRIKDSKCVMIGRSSSTQMSIATLKNSELYAIPKRIPVETLGILQYSI